MFLQLPIHRKTTKTEVLIFIAHAHCFKVKDNLLTVKIPDNTAFKKLFSDTNVNTEIPDMSGKFRTYGCPKKSIISTCLKVSNVT